MFLHRSCEIREMKEERALRLLSAVFKHPLSSQVSSIFQEEAESGPVVDEPEVSEVHPEWAWESAAAAVQGC